MVVGCEGEGPEAVSGRKQYKNGALPKMRQGSKRGKGGERVRSNLLSVVPEWGAYVAQHTPHAKVVATRGCFQDPVDTTLCMDFRAKTAISFPRFGPRLAFGELVFGNVKVKKRHPKIEHCIIDR